MLMITNTTITFQMTPMRFLFFWVNSIDTVYYSTGFSMAHHTQQLKKGVKEPPRSSSRQPIHFPWLFVVALLVTIFIASRAVGVMRKKADAGVMNTGYRSELQQLEEKERSMQAELGELETPAGIEREIREKFRVTKAGEELVVVVPSENPVQDADQQHKGLFHFLGALFKSK